MYAVAGLPMKIEYNLEKCVLVLLDIALKTNDKKLQKETMISSIET